ncbi:thioester reductase domain-containing protein [Clostridium saccharobutylicum]|uniref:LgrD: linear gramicidin synthase subunit D n=1 Tax=Clostridium saccharobutylicum DSM 13864 TaxID=1345695 RepID=U5MSQ1_CLOSA|nr:thioester reductase domain-containing protein [Clostridium saccharobutylicum]AGX42691.1 lgrD: linear gramicidin synthase subunit D [Clostridium saccharobutylicum DSM 13864]AQR89983.1 linear gramicidin synthase subunit D [Clostridium saccharobutylicum]AQR99888.1 linear gramicidin synthase subunit D [Clostridium saccharobutylicum]AQS13872.1 linear gramicidin synthase subunit D [Clostridium saccharobutylicum]MBA2904721.1 thioester reductase-like protein [Clostridium saccharobutylicum]
MNKELYLEKLKKDMKEKIKAIWEEVLEKDSIEYKDNYFLIGGNSLTAIKILRKIKEAIGYDKEIPLTYIFSFPTIEKLVDQIFNLDEFGKKAINITAKQLKDEVKIDLPHVNYNSKYALENCLLTGSSGYLGGYILRELLKQTNMQIYCLVRGKSYEDAEKKIKKNLDKFKVSNEEVKRIHIVLGDFGHKNMGMSEKEYEELSNKIDCIYHNGALVHFLYSYEELKQSNVEGTKEILKFAVFNKIKAVFYVSTISIFSKFAKSNSQVLENEGIEDSGILPIGYTQSKWVAEALVWKAKEKGLPVMVFRIGHVIGDSVTGECHSDDFVFRIIKSVLDVHAYPDIDGKLEPITVDDVAKTIVAISKKQNNLGQAYHLINPQPVYFNDMVKWAENKNILLQPLPKNKWVKEIEKLEKVSTILPFIQFFGDNLWDVYKDLEFSVENTKRALAEQDISIQAISDTIIERHYNYLKNKGELEEIDLYTVGTI